MAHEWTENQLKWLKALRSGKYKQGTERLKTSKGGYCCLGVACAELYGDRARGKWFNEGEIAPDKLVEDLSLHNRDARIYTKHGKMGSLTRANDSGATFEEIADFIEQNPEAVFRQ